MGFHQPKLLLQDLVDGGGVISSSRQTSSAVQLVCTNPGCTVATWMNAGDWEARVTSAQLGQQRRGWNGDEDDWRPDHGGAPNAGLGGAAPNCGFGGHLACPCGRGWRRRATMPSSASQAAVARRIQQLRQIRRSEPLLAAASGTQCPSHPAWSFQPPWTSSGSPVIRPPQRLGIHDSLQDPFPAAARQRVLSEPETPGASGYACAGTAATPTGFGLRAAQSAARCSGDPLGASFAAVLRLNSVDAPRGHNQEQAGRQRNLAGKYWAFSYACSSKQCSV